MLSLATLVIILGALPVLLLILFSGTIGFIATFMDDERRDYALEFQHRAENMIRSLGGLRSKRRSVALVKGAWRRKAARRKGAPQLEVAPKLVEAPKLETASELR